MYREMLKSKKRKGVFAEMRTKIKKARKAGLGIIGEFKSFAVKGNVLDMAVGVIIGGAFGKIVTSFVNDVVMPPIGLLLGNKRFVDFKWVMKAAGTGETGEAIPEVALNYGAFLQNIFDFLIVALCIFLFVRFMAKMKKALEKKSKEAPPLAEPPPPPEKTPTEVLLGEILEELRKGI